MYLIRHHDPGDQFVFLIRVKKYRVGDHSANIFILQKTTSVPVIKKLFDLLTNFKFDVFNIFVLKFDLKTPQYILRKRVDKPRREKLRNLPAVEMRQIATGIPTFRTRFFHLYI